MNVSPTLIACPQPAELVHPGQGPLHHPAIDSQAASMLGKPSGQYRPDPQPAQDTSVRVRVVSPISLGLIRSTPGMPLLPPNGRYALHQGQQLGHIRPVRPGQGGGQRNPLSVGNHMVLATRLAPVRRIGFGFFPTTYGPDGGAVYHGSGPVDLVGFPQFGQQEFTSARPQRQSRSRRQQVMPDPQPISWGSISQGMPLFRTNRMPVKAWRSLMGFRTG